MLAWAAGVVAVASATAWWASTAWNRVTVDISFEPARAFIGEPTFLVIRIANAKRSDVADRTDRRASA